MIFQIKWNSLKILNYVCSVKGHNLTVVMGDWLSFIIDHWLESVYEFICDFANYNRFTYIHRIKYFLCQKEIQEHLVITLSMYLSVCKGS